MIAVGDLAPPLERTINLVDMIAYAGATWDWHRLHYDPEYLRATGLPKPVVDGQLFGALLAEQLQDWLGEEAFVHRLRLRYKSLMFAGETARCHAQVTALEPSGNRLLVRVECRVETAGAEARVVVAPAGAEVTVPR